MARRRLARERLVLHGKWRPEHPEPKWGWHRDPELGSYDRGPYRAKRCQMCLKEDVRFTHVMIHSDWPEALHVGFWCAGHMIGTRNCPNFDLVEEWERVLRTAAKRDFAEMVAEAKKALRIQWRMGTDGHSRLRASHHKATVFTHAGEVSLRLQRPDKSYTFLPHTSRESAKRTAERVLATASVRMVLKQNAAPPFTEDTWLADMKNIFGEDFGQQG